MIKLMRVDHRLLHGQVAFSWTSALSADCILIANNEVFDDEIQLMALKLAKPNGVKLVIKNVKDSIEAINSGVTEKYKLFVVVGNIEDAYKIAMNTEINSINLGGTRALEGTKNISKAVNVFEKEETLLNELVDQGIEVEIRMVPNDAKVLYSSLK